MRLLLGLIFGLLLGGALAVVLATRAASRQPDDAAIFDGDAPPHRAPSTART